MVAFGAYLLVSVAAAAPAHADAKLASWYEDAACDPNDGGECALEIDLSVPAPAAILDCESPLLHDMIGSCDSPKPTLPSLHVPTVHAASGLAVARAPGGRVTVVMPAPPIDAALPSPSPSLRGYAPADVLPLATSELRLTLLTHRLERPPRA